MRKHPLSSTVSLIFFTFWLSQPVRAQVYEDVGIRARGMGGAFVAVADDATATWWNPAGLATAAYFSAIAEYGSTQDPRNATPNGAPVVSDRTKTLGFSAALPSLGLSYYRLQISEIRGLSSTGSQGQNRQDQGPLSALQRLVVANQFGATVGHSIGDHFVVGTTVKLLQTDTGSDVVDLANASLDRASDLPKSGETHGDLDIGVMAKFQGGRVGLTVRNVTAPTVGGIELNRQARVGFALLGPSATLSVDGDLTRTATATGDERRICAGMEFRGSRLQYRGGFSLNTTGSVRPAYSGGLSAAVSPKIFIDGQGTIGSDEAVAGWGIALRVTF